MSDQDDEYLTGPDLDRRYKRSSQTRWRWSKDPQLGFPKPIRIKNRLLYRRRDVEEFERRMAAASAGRSAETLARTAHASIGSEAVATSL